MHLSNIWCGNWSICAFLTTIDIQLINHRIAIKIKMEGERKKPDEVNKNKQLYL